LIFLHENNLIQKIKPCPLSARRGLTISFISSSEIDEEKTKMISKITPGEPKNKDYFESRPRGCYNKKN
jgi:hypothetical protein